MSDTMQASLLGLFTLASCIWVGGYVAIAVVARVATSTLEPAARVAFFKGLGRAYGVVGVIALVVALATGAGLTHAHAWDGPLISTAILAAALVVALAVGVLQARRMTRLRARHLATPEDAELARRVRQGARSAGMLRAAIGVLSLALIALGSVLAT